MSTTLQAVQKILLANYPLKIEAIGPDARLDALDIDSLSIVEVLFEVEEKFGIVVPSDSSTMRNGLKTVGDLLSYVDTLIAQRGADAEASIDAADSLTVPSTTITKAT